MVASPRPGLSAQREDAYNWWRRFSLNRVAFFVTFFPRFVIACPVTAMCRYFAWTIGKRNVFSAIFSFLSGLSPFLPNIGMSI
jgi:hypothetical protein